MRKVRMLVAVAAAVIASSAVAEGWYEAPAATTHHGTYLHLELGVAGLQSKTSEITLKGGGGSFVLALGSSVTDRVVLGGELWDVVALKPTVNGGGSASQAALVGIGPTVRAWADDDVFFSLTPSLTRVTIQASGVTGSTKLGFGGRMAVGKEWKSQGSRWGFGVALNLAFSVNKDDGSSKVKSFGGGLNFSATMN